MCQSTQLEIIFSQKVLRIWRLATIFLLATSFFVPMIYETPDSGGLLSSSNNLLTFIVTYGLTSLVVMPNGLFGELSYQGISPTLLSYPYWLFINSGSISVLGYTSWTIISYLKCWQRPFQLRFWLLGLVCLWTVFFGWSFQGDALLWGFKVLVCALMSAVLWEGVNYRLYRR